MLRSKLKLFEKGDQLICVHDIENQYEIIHTGDLVTVWDVCDKCLGLLLEGHEVHYQDIDFEKFKTERIKFFHRDPNMVERKKVANVFNDIIKVMMMNSHRGACEIQPIIDCIKYNIAVLDVEPEFKQPLNRPEPPEEEK